MFRVNRWDSASRSTLSCRRLLSTSPRSEGHGEWLTSASVVAHRPGRMTRYNYYRESAHKRRVCGVQTAYLLSGDLLDFPGFLTEAQGKFASCFTSLCKTVLPLVAVSANIHTHILKPCSSRNKSLLARRCLVTHHHTQVAVSSGEIRQADPGLLRSVLKGA